MDKLTQVYLELATDPQKFEAFNHGLDILEKQASRKKYLENAGIEDCEDVINLTESELQTVLSTKLSEQQQNWADIQKHRDNTNNTDNRVSKLGVRAL